MKILRLGGVIGVILLWQGCTSLGNYAPARVLPDSLREVGFGTPIWMLASGQTDMGMAPEIYARTGMDGQWEMEVRTYPVFFPATFVMVGLRHQFTPADDRKGFVFTAGLSASYTFYFGPTPQDNPALGALAVYPAVWLGFRDLYFGTRTTYMVPGLYGTQQHGMFAEVLNTIFLGWVFEGPYRRSYLELTLQRFSPDFTDASLPWMFALSFGIGIKQPEIPRMPRIPPAPPVPPAHGALHSL